MFVEPPDVLLQLPVPGVVRVPPAVAQIVIPIGAYEVLGKADVTQGLPAAVRSVMAPLARPIGVHKPCCGTIPVHGPVTRSVVHEVEPDTDRVPGPIPKERRRTTRIAQSSPTVIESELVPLARPVFIRKSLSVPIFEKTLIWRIVVLVAETVSYGVPCPVTEESCIEIIIPQRLP